MSGHPASSVLSAPHAVRGPSTSAGAAKTVVSSTHPCDILARLCQLDKLFDIRQPLLVIVVPLRGSVRDRFVRGVGLCRSRIARRWTRLHSSRRERSTRTTTCAGQHAPPARVARTRVPGHRRARQQNFAVSPPWSARKVERLGSLEANPKLYGQNHQWWQKPSGRGRVLDWVAIAKTSRSCMACVRIVRDLVLLNFW